ncbi:hypothetical protein V8E51_013640 [Hyaloscypha variabilis]
MDISINLPPQSTIPTGVEQGQSGLATSLVGTNDLLQMENEQLRSENAALLARLSRLQDQISAFWRFPQLPVEVREMIWNEALKIPQIHLMDYKKITLSQINVIMQSCREARSLGLLFQFPYYQLDIDVELNATSPKYYINLDVDTIWLPRDQYIPEFVNFYCSLCRGAIFPMRGRPEVVCSHKSRLRRVGMSASCWREPSRVGFKENGALVLRQFRVQELFIAVDGLEDAMNEDVDFHEPTMRARPYDSWEEASDDIEESLRVWRERNIQQSIDNGPDTEDGEEGDEDGLKAFLDWKVLKVKHVGLSQKGVYTYTRVHSYVKSKKSGYIERKRGPESVAGEINRGKVSSNICVPARSQLEQAEATLIANSGY